MFVNRAGYGKRVQLGGFNSRIELIQYGPCDTSISIYGPRDIMLNREKARLNLAMWPRRFNTLKYFCPSYPVM